MDGQVLNCPHSTNGSAAMKAMELSRMPSMPGQKFDFFRRPCYPRLSQSFLPRVIEKSALSADLPPSLLKLFFMLIRKLGKASNKQAIAVLEPEKCSHSFIKTDIKNKYSLQTTIYKHMLLQHIIMMQSPNTTPITPDLLSESQQNTAKYLQISQLAYYSSLEKIAPLGIFTMSPYDVQCNVVFCFHADKFRVHERKKEEITCFIIRTLNEEIPKLKNRYSIAYVHDTVGDFLYFRNVVRLMPIEYLSKMKEFFIVDGGVGVKLVQFLSCGEINRYIKQKTRHIAQVHDIQSQKKIALVNTPSCTKLRSQDSQRNTLTVTKELQSSDIKIIRNKLYGKELSQYQLSMSGIPVIIEELLGHLYGNVHFLRAEGIMRKSCDVQELELLEQRIMEDHNWKQFVRTYQNVYVICGCFKKVLNNLNTPLFSYQIYDSIISYRSDGHLENDIKFFRSCLTKMPKLHREVLYYIIAFMKKGIILHQDSNKMSAYNLAVVFGPCFFRPKVYRLQDLMSSGKFSFLIKLMLENFQDVAGEENVYRMYAKLEKDKENYGSL